MQPEFLNNDGVVVLSDNGVSYFYAGIVDWEVGKIGELNLFSQENEVVTTVAPGWEEITFNCPCED